jgi:pyruvate/2-oxoacid:ferredoxin oxidoreductase alpha subunit
VSDQYFMEYKYQQQEAMENAKRVIEEVDQEFGERFGRAYGGLLQPYRMEDAEVAILAMGSNCGLARMAVDDFRKEGIALGSIKLRVFRPFPEEELRTMTKHLKLLIVLDRDASIGMGGIVHSEVAGSLYSMKSRPALVNYIVGLGGRVLTLDQLKALTKEAITCTKEDRLEPSVRWVGVRGLE